MSEVAGIKRKPVTSLWLVVNYNEDMPYRITLETGEESIPIIGHGHHQLSWIVHDLIKERDELKNALRVLRNETKGTLKAHELAIRYDHGNSNWRCLEIALEGAEKLLETK